MTKKRFSLLLLMIFTIFVFALPSQAAPKLSKKSANLLAGESIQLHVSGARKAAVWSSNNRSVARVKAGLVKARKAGRAVITAKVGAKKLTCTVTVKASPLKVPVTEVTVKAGSRKTINVSIGGYGRIDVSNDNSDVAHIELGTFKGTTVPVTVYGRARGVSKIEIKSSLSNKKVTIRVTVTE